MRMVWAIRRILYALGNLYWKIFGGLLLALFWIALAVAFTLTVVGAPLAIACMRAAYVSYKPFGKRVSVVIDRPVLSLVWLFTAGVAMGVFCVAGVMACMITIVGIPMIPQWGKVAVVSAMPFGSRVGS